MDRVSEGVGTTTSIAFTAWALDVAAITLVPDGGGHPVVITARREADGSRTVAGPPNAIRLLAQLNREFVLLDHGTFQSFIDDKDLDRGRSFAGLLGLKQYPTPGSNCKLSQTHAYNGIGSTAALEHSERTAESDLQRHGRAAEVAFEALTTKRLADHADARTAAHAALEQIPLLKSHCTGKLFDEIDLNACIAAIKQAEGGEDPVRLAELIRGADGAGKRRKGRSHRRRSNSTEEPTTRRDRTLCGRWEAHLAPTLSSGRTVLTQDARQQKSLPHLRHTK